VLSHTEAEGSLRILSTADIAGIEIALTEVVDVVEQAYLALAAEVSTNPRKLSVKPADSHSVAYAMLGRDGERQVVAIKTSYKFDPERDRDRQRYYTSLTLYDDVTGRPIALMDCARIGSLRTPAVSALIARACATPESRNALVIGTGTQGRLALPFLLTTMPDLDRLMLFGTHPQGIRAVREQLHRYFPERDLEVVTNLQGAAAEADVVIAAAGAATPAAVEVDWLKPGTLSVLVGHGLDPSTLHHADRVLATSAEQMAVTGVDMAAPDGQLPAVAAEFPAVFSGREEGRRDESERIFAYNSGLVVTDIALGHRFAQQAIADGLGTVIPLWR
jgi:N-[(2S)-2-amino-2-carboxyethyl]-L-glutamate dehydrogenase